MYTIINGVWQRSMKLHELVLLRNELQKAIDLSTIKLELEKNKASLQSMATLGNEKYQQQITCAAAELHNKIFTNLDQDLASIQHIIDQVAHEIDVKTKKFFEKNYQTEYTHASPGIIRDIKRMAMVEGSDTTLISRIRLYSGWKYPALEIGCRDGEWTKHLVSSDPLYISDMHQEFLDNTNNQFTPEYQARLRKYLIVDYKINELPANQFGFIFSYNFFNYLSLDSIKQFLIQSLTWLKPGGIILFTYNNGDLSASAGLSESYFMTYVPKSMLLPLAESLGFEVVAAPDFLPSTSWVELKKPGTLSTVKAHQVLGEIKYR